MSTSKKISCIVLSIGILLGVGGTIWYFALPEKEIISTGNSNSTSDGQVRVNADPETTVSAISTTSVTPKMPHQDPTPAPTTEDPTPAPTTEEIAEIDDIVERPTETVTYLVKTQTCNKIKIEESKKCAADFSDYGNGCVADFLCDDICCGDGHCDAGMCVCLTENQNPSDNCKSKTFAEN